MGRVGCYTLDLYCDCPTHSARQEYMDQFTGRTEAACLRGAKRAGWIVRRKPDGRESGWAICPECRSAEKARPQ